MQSLLSAGRVALRGPEETPTRLEALRLYTQGSSWFSNEQSSKGTLAPGQYADLIALTDDYFHVPEDDIRRIESVLTIVDGKVVHASQGFAPLAPPTLPILPEWSPLSVFGGYGAPLDVARCARAGVPMAKSHASGCHVHGPGCNHGAHALDALLAGATQRLSGFFGSGCDCFAF